MVKLWALSNMKSTSKYIFLILISGFIAAQGEKISGAVFDASTGLPLVGANIIINETGSGTASASDGSFHIDSIPAGSYTLTVSMIGYAAETLTYDHLSGMTCNQSVYLTPIILESNLGIHVFGRREANKAFQHIQKTNLSSTENMISMVEGVSLIRRGNYAQEPVIRGLSGGQINVTINGMKSFGACTDRMDPVSSYVEADALNSVEIGKGSLSLINGSTIGGSLNMTFLPPEISPQPHSAWFIKGSLHSVIREKKMTANWQYKTPGSGISLNSTYRKAEDYTAAGGETIPFSGYEKFSFNMGLLKQLRGTTQLLMELISDDAWDVGYASLPMDVGYARMRMLGLTIKTSGLKSYLPRMEWKVYGNLVDHWMDDSKRSNRFMNMHMDMPGRTRTVGSYLDMVIARNGVSSLILRSDFFWNSSYADMVMYPENSTPMKIVTWPDMHRWNAGQYIGYQYALSAKTTLKSSLRYDFYSSSIHDEMGKGLLRIYYPDNSFSRQDHLVSGNISMVHRFSSFWQSTLAVAKGSRVPTVTEAYGYYLYIPVDGYLYLGHPDLPVENSTQLEVRNRFSTDRVDVTTNLFQYNFRNYIIGQVMDTATALGYAKGWKLYSDGGKAKLIGAEASLLFKINRHWVLLGGMNLQIGELLDLHDYIPMISPFAAHASITYQQKTYWIQLEVKGSGEQNRFSVLSGENHTPGFAVYSLKAEYRFAKRLKLNMGVENLTNRLYHEHLDWEDINRPGRNVVLSLTIDK